MHPIATYRHATRCFTSDDAFNSLYPADIQNLANRHWTPLRVTRAAIGFLTPRKGMRVLDIGSGIGKFCLAAAYYKPSSFFTGIEQRSSLVNLSCEVQTRLGLKNVNFLHDNFTRINFHEFNHFYFFNSFYENLVGANKIDESIDYTTELYNYYCRCLYHKLDDMPSGTRVVTFHSLEDEMPFSYEPVDSRFNNRLKYWIKK